MPDAGEKRIIPLRAWPIAAFFALVAPIAAGGAMGLPAIQTILGLAGAPWRGLAPRTAAAWAFPASLAAFLAWTSLSALWSPYGEHSLAWRLPGAVICGLLLVAGAGADAGSRRLVRSVGVACVAVLAVLLLIEAFAGLPLNRLAQPDAEAGLLERNPARGATVLVILCWGMLGALAGGASFERMAWRVLLAAVGVLALQFGMAANALAFGVGLIGFAAGRMAPRFAIISMCVLMAAWLLAAPFVFPLLASQEALVAKLPLSWAHRAEIWRFTAETIQAHPWFGWGLDASRTFAETKLVRGMEFNLMPLHPHSASLHVWLETGAVGAGLAAAALVTGGVALAQALKNQPAAAGAACGVIGVCAVIDNVSFGAWQEWWIAATFAGAALVAAAYRTPAAAPKDDY